MIKRYEVSHSSPPLLTSAEWPCAWDTTQTGKGKEHEVLPL